MSDNDITVLPWLLYKKNWWPFCFDQLHKQIIHQNAQIFKKKNDWKLHHQNCWFKIKRKTMKMSSHFVISAGWASTIFGPCKWQLSACRLLLTGEHHCGKIVTLFFHFYRYSCSWKSRLGKKYCLKFLGWRALFQVGTEYWHWSNLSPWWGVKQKRCLPGYSRVSWSKIENCFG